jgi:hypothetical protein
MKGESAHAKLLVSETVAGSAAIWNSSASLSTEHHMLDPRE